MKLAFLCGSLEPGCDGVGDYVRRLASEIILQGHNPILVAINDPYIISEYKGVQRVGNVDVVVIRIPSSLSVKERFRLVKKRINAFTPDWLSIQFVPYAFHSKGLPFFSALYLKEIAKKRRVHIMFHELWVDRTDNRWRLTILSVLQKLIIKKILRSIRPSVVHTHLPIYHFRLQKLGLAPKILPLFSNIGVANKKYRNTESNLFRIGFFSQVENNKSVISFLSSLGKQIVQKKMQLEVLLIGGAKTKMIDFASRIEQIENHKNKVTHTGFLAPEELSEALQSCTLGITPVPRHVLGKSGSVAAFLAHGVPVAAPHVREYYGPAKIGFSIPELCASIMLEPEFKQLQNSKNAALKAGEEIALDKIARTFLSDLGDILSESPN